jgi:hypothetical protein
MEDSNVATRPGGGTRSASVRGLSRAKWGLFFAPIWYICRLVSATPIGVAFECFAHEQKHGIPGPMSYAEWRHATALE